MSERRRLFAWFWMSKCRDAVIAIDEDRHGHRRIEPLSATWLP